MNLPAIDILLPQCSGCRSTNLKIYGTVKRGVLRYCLCLDCGGRFHGRVKNPKPRASQESGGRVSKQESSEIPQRGTLGRAQREPKADDNEVQSTR